MAIGLLTTVDAPASKSHGVLLAMKLQDASTMTLHRWELLASDHHLTTKEMLSLTKPPLLDISMIALFTPGEIFGIQKMLSNLQIM